MFFCLRALSVVERRVRIAIHEGRDARTFSGDCTLEGSKAQVGELDLATKYSADH